MLKYMRCMLWTECNGAKRRDDPCKFSEIEGGPWLVSDRLQIKFAGCGSFGREPALALELRYSVTGVLVEKYPQWRRQVSRWELRRVESYAFSTSFLQPNFLSTEATSHPLSTHIDIVCTKALFNHTFSSSSFAFIPNFRTHGRPHQEPSPKACCWGRLDSWCVLSISQAIAWFCCTRLRAPEDWQ